MANCLLLLPAKAWCQHTGPSDESSFMIVAVATEIEPIIWAAFMHCFDAAEVADERNQLKVPSGHNRVGYNVIEAVIGIGDESNRGTLKIVGEDERFRGWYPGSGLDLDEEEIKGLQADATWHHQLAIIQGQHMFDCLKNLSVF
ncbi:hypothetical protein F4780DRAFT_774709 [Xylariomycetidae sp. FL0641]|nr:hypothetical protein F4780DRAFT_774709 [Xylariomycetidae sp. FL0641]